MEATPAGTGAKPTAAGAHRRMRVCAGHGTGLNRNPTTPTLFRKLGGGRRCSKPDEPLPLRDHSAGLSLRCSATAHRVAIPWPALRSNESQLRAHA